MLHTITEAAKLAGRARTTFYKLIDDGVISVTTNNAGQKGIETSELLRVFPDIKIEQSNTSDGVNSCLNMSNNNTSANNDGVRFVIENLNKTIETLEKQLEQANCRADKYEQRSEILQDKLNAFLLPPPAPPQNKKWYEFWK